MMLKKLAQGTLCGLFICVFLLTSGTQTVAVQNYTGTGTAEDPFVIYTAEGFNYLAALMNTPQYYTQYYKGHYKLGDDLDFSETFVSPLGKRSYSFQGTFDGNGYTIYNLNSNLSEYGGAFGKIENAVIKNVKVKNANITGSMWIGGLVGYASHSQIINCSVEGVVSGKEHVGGLAGYLGAESKIINSYAEIMVTGNYLEIGGLVGVAAGGEIVNSFVRGSVTSTGAAFPIDGHVGGMVGKLEGKIEESFADVQVKAPSSKEYDRIGGLVGENNGTISNSYVLGSVEAYHAGGLVGWNGINQSITNSFAANQLTATSGGQVGGLVHTNVGNIANAYWDRTLSNQSNAAIHNTGTIAGSVSGKTTQEMKTVSTYAGWDFTQLWAMASNEYPNLKRANLIEFDSSQRQITMEAGQTESVTITARYSNGTTQDVTDTVSAELVSLMGSTVEQANGKINITGGREARGFLRVSQAGITNFFPITVVAGPVSVEQSTVVAQSPTVVADGASTVGIIVTVMDKGLNPLQGHPVTLHGNDGGSSTISTNPQTADQAGQAAFQVKSTRAGTVRYYAEVQEAGTNKKIEQEAAVVFVAGAPYAGQSKINIDTATPHTVDKEIEVKVTLMDQYANPLENVNVELIPSSATEPLTITPSLIQTDAQGVATFTVSSKQIQDISLTVKVNGTEMSELTTTTTFVPGVASGVHSKIIMVNEPLVVGEQRSLTVQLKDQYGNPLQAGGDKERIAWDAALSERIVFAEDHGNGTYTYTYTAPTVAGTDTITGAVSGTTMSKAIQLVINPDEADGAQSEIRMDMTPIIVGQSRVFTVQLKDRYGNALQSGGNEEQIEWDSSIQGSITFDQDNGNGTYSYTYTAPTTAGTDTITGTVSGTAMSSVQLDVISDIADGAHSVIIIDTTPITAGQSREITVQLKDRHSNPLQRGGDKDSISWAPPIRGSISFVKDNDDGTYTYTYTAPTTVGTDTIAGTVSGSPMVNSITLNVIPSSVAEASIEPVDRKVVVGQELLITLTLNDQYGNPVDEQTLSLSQKTGTPTTIIPVNGG